MSEEIITVDQEETPIQQFYNGATIFITGGTGFLGRILIEKLLRSCPNLSTIYLLVRNKKGKNIDTRLDELFDDIIFERLRKQFPKIRHKAVGMAGDCSLPDLGLSPQDRQLLIDTVSVVFHVAATVRFDEKLKLAVAINVRGTLDVINLSKQMPHLKSIVHVSTAYSNCPNRVIEERFYQAPIDGRKLILLADSLSDKMLDKLTTTIVDKWPNTYAYTKAVAESVVKQEAQNLPIAVFRPSIVVSTYKEPVVGWINNLYGPTGVSAGAGSGVLRTLHCDPKVNANVIPVDMCVNSLIATAWEVGTAHYNDASAKKQEQPSIANNKDDGLDDNNDCNNNNIPIYHFESSNDQPITWGRFMNLSESYGILVPTVKSIWCYSLTLQRTLIGYFITSILLHYLPALLVDTALFCVGKSPKMLKIYKKIHKFSSVISYFCTQNWKFQSTRVRTLIEHMSERDRAIFFCDLKQLDWNNFFVTYLRGIRIFLLQDPIDTLDEAISRYNRFYYLHQTIKMVGIFVLLRLVWWMGTSFYK